MMAYSGEIRPCLVEGERALFHGWVDIEKPLMEDGKVLCCYKGANGVVEMENGAVRCVTPSAICFIDTAQVMTEYDWTIGGAT